MTWTLTTLLLDFWQKWEHDMWAGYDTIRLIRCDNAREQYGIPSFLD